MHKEVRWYCAVSALAILTLPGAAIARGADEPAGAAAALSGEPQDAAPQATQTDIATEAQSSQGSEIVDTGLRTSLARLAAEHGSASYRERMGQDGENPV